MTDTANPQDLEAIFNKALEGPFMHGSSFEFDPEKIQARLVIKGASWKGYVDLAIANFILDLDRTLRSVLAESGIEVPDSPRGIVVLEVRDGSTDARLKFSEAILKQWSKMKPTDKMFLVAAILGGIMAWRLPESITSWKAPELERARYEHVVKMQESLVKIMEAEPVIQKPLKGLVKKLDENDTVQLPTADHAVKRDNVIAMFSPATRTPSDNYLIDEAYIVEEITTRRPGKWHVGLKYGNISFRAELLLSNQQIETLLAAVQEAHARRSDIAPDFQVTARVNAKGVREAKVVGLGPKRADSVGLAAALASEKDKLTRR